MTIIDISPSLSSRIAVWPGDTPLSRNVLCDISKGSNIDLSSIHSTVHLGAHADAPRHFHPDGVTMEQVPLDAYIGPCQVISVIGRPLVTIDDCKPAVDSGIKRILFKTLSFPDPEAFTTNFTAIASDAMAYMGQHGVVLVGIDTPSVDPFDSKTLDAHQQLYKYRIANVEGLILTHVNDGLYEFIGLPLKLVGFDASPIRAILKLPS
jgi:arylformamidase